MDGAADLGFVDDMLRLAESLVNDRLGHARGEIRLPSGVVVYACEALRAAATHPEQLGLPRALTDIDRQLLRNEFMRLFEGYDASQFGTRLHELVLELGVAYQDPLCDDGIIGCDDNGCWDFNNIKTGLIASCIDYNPIPFFSNCFCWIIDLKRIKWWQWLLLAAVAVVSVALLIRVAPAVAAGARVAF